MNESSDVNQAINTLLKQKFEIIGILENQSRNVRYQIRCQICKNEMTEKNWKRHRERCSLDPERMSQIITYTNLNERLAKMEESWEEIKHFLSNNWSFNITWRNHDDVKVIKLQLFQWIAVKVIPLTSIYCDSFMQFVKSLTSLDLPLN
jgi:hypothetical protein